MSFDDLQTSIANIDASTNPARGVAHATTTTATPITSSTHGGLTSFTEPTLESPELAMNFSMPGSFESTVTSAEETSYHRFASGVFALSTDGHLKNSSGSYYQHHHHNSSYSSTTSTGSARKASTSSHLFSKVRASARTPQQQQQQQHPLANGLRHDLGVSHSTAARITHDHSPQQQHLQHLGSSALTSRLPSTSASPSHLSRQSLGPSTKLGGTTASASTAASRSSLANATAHANGSHGSPQLTYHRPPRKSIGPGILTYSHTSAYEASPPEKFPVRRRPSLAKRKSGDLVKFLRGTPSEKANAPSTVPSFLQHDYAAATGGSTESVNPPGLALRAQRAMSMLPSHPFLTDHPPPPTPRERQTPRATRSPHREDLMMKNVDPAGVATSHIPADEYRTSPQTGNGTSSGKHTPTAKRISMVPPHHTGLGARTISPTDVQKLKRMSVASSASHGDGGPVVSAADAPPTPYLDLDSTSTAFLSQAIASPSLHITFGPTSPPLPHSPGLRTSSGAPGQGSIAGTATTTASTTTPTTRSVTSRPKSSASLIPRKTSATPSLSSTRDTPDPARKGLSSAAAARGGIAREASPSGLGIACPSPFLKDASNHIQTDVSNADGSGSGVASYHSRSSHISSASSRLPTPKSRSSNSSDQPQAAASNPDDEEVPPVPAIPKAYESPRISAEQQRQLTPSSSHILSSAAVANGTMAHRSSHVSTVRKSSLPLTALAGEGPALAPAPAPELLSSTAMQPSTPSTLATGSVGGMQDETPIFFAPSPMTGKPTSAGNGSSRPRPLHLDHKASQSPLPRNRLQPLKLPPLNLAPLSGSIARQIDALKTRHPNKRPADSGGSEEHAPATPPPPPHHPRTPTTPITASKAITFSTRDFEPELPHTTQARRSASTRFGDFMTHDLSVTHPPESGKDGSPGYPPAGIEAVLEKGHMPSQGMSGHSTAAQALAHRDLPGDMSASMLETGADTGKDARHSSYNALASKTLVAGSYPATASQASNSMTKLTGPRPISQQPPLVSTSRMRSGETPNGVNSVLNTITPRSTRHETATAQASRVGLSSAALGTKPPALTSSVARGGLATKPGSLHIRRRSAGNALTQGLGAGGAGGMGMRAPSLGGPSTMTAATAASATSSAGGVSPEGRVAGAIQQLTHRSSPAGSHLRASGVAGPRSVSMSAGAKLRPVDHMIDKDDLAAEEEMRRLGQRRRDFELHARSLDDLRKRVSPKERISPAQALRSADLNMFEKGEIVDFKEIYFTGTPRAKKHIGDLHASAANFGYDDERGDYNIVIGDHLAYRYEVVDVLGKGSFGQVVRCIDHKTGALSAVKIIRNKKRFHQQALVEVSLLAKLKEWDPHKRHSVVSFTQSFYFRGHLCISTELLGMNLYELTKAHDFKGFSLRIIRRFTKQILSTLVLLHHHKVIHCDLKPENILLAHPLRTEIKTIDFGSSCFENEKVYTYIQSRFYRSPEVILGMSYGMPIDMWSLGCIMAELYTGYPIFPGENEQEQLACIMEIFGPPERHLIEKSSRRKLFFDSNGKPRTTVSSKGRRRRPSSKDLRTALKCDDEAFLDFIARCLRWDPCRRLNPIDAMSHEFITGIKAAPRARHYASSSSMKRTLTARPLPDPPAIAGAGSSAATSTGAGMGLSMQSPASFKPVGATPASAVKASAAQNMGNVSVNPNANGHSHSNSPRLSSPSKYATRRTTVNSSAASAAAAMAAGSSVAAASAAASGTPSTHRRLTAVASSGNLVGSALPRVTQRSVSGKPDLATAAAAASLAS
ncbi:hypothetical protein KEM52_003921 [Ascosphaera acerosa]|nr:hypothetical protein KEM52_003921 [Ascosphaera acerosa]